MNGDNITQSEMRKPEAGGDRDVEVRQALFHNRQNTPLRYFSMFTGVGGFELGIDRSRQSDNFRFHEGSRIECIGFSEIDKYASQLLAAKWPTIKNYGDCTKINPRELPDFDMLCGGFPCQSFSIAGKRRGFEDTRGTMFFEVARILEAKRPKLVFLENVKGLLNHDKGQTFRTIIQTLEELGYRTQWMVLNSKFFGVPQNRERVFIIGSLRGEPRPEILPFREDDQEIIREINPKGMEQTAQCLKERDYQNWNGNFTKDGSIRTLSGGAHSGGLHSDMTFISEPKIDLIQQSQAQHSRIYGKEGISPTLAGASKTSGDCTPKIMDLYNNKEHSDRTPALTEPHHNSLRLREGMRIRRLTPIECERLQGFPDNWTAGFSDTQRYKMMGNAVTVNVIEAIARKLK